MIVLYLIFFIFLTLCVCFGFWLHYQWKKNYETLQESFKSEEITVVIPFRNEEKNLPHLLQSLSKLKTLPKEIIFVNDHSVDDSLQCLKDFGGNLPLKVLHLNQDEIGKKTAIRKGIEFALTDYILTWDADIIVNPNYFRKLENINKSDMLILPVRMKATSFLAIFYELDYYYLNAISTSISFFSKPVVASGANLLFNKKVFDEVDSIDEHIEIASGDDMFLLEDFKNNGKSIQVETAYLLQVETKTPSTVEDFIFQRLRWISKSQHITSYMSLFLSISGFIFHVGFYLFFFTDVSWSQLKILTISKLIMDVCVFIPYLILLKRTILIAAIPFFSFVYPIYSLLLLSMTLFYKPEWKGRG